MWWHHTNEIARGQLGKIEIKLPPLPSKSPLLKCCPAWTPEIEALEQRLTKTRDPEAGDDAGAANGQNSTSTPGGTPCLTSPALERETQKSRRRPVHGTTPGPIGWANRYLSKWEYKRGTQSRG